MKIKDDIINWKEQVQTLTKKMTDFEVKSQIIYSDIKELKQQVLNLAKITEEMTETMLMLIRQQLGD